MKRINSKKIRGVLVVLLAITLSFSPVFQVFATTEAEYQKQKENLQDKQKEASSDKKEAKDKLNGLKNEQSELQDNVDDINKNIDSVQAEIAGIASQIDSASNDIDSLNQALEQAEKDKEDAYKSLKTSIAYNYEQSTSKSALTEILSSKSIGDMLNRVSYMADYSRYMNGLMDSYQELQQTIKTKTSELETKKTDLSSYQSTLSSKREELSGLLNEANGNLIAKNKEVDVAKMSVQEFDQLINSYEQEEKKLDEQYFDAQEALAKQIEAQEAEANKQAQNNQTDNTTQPDNNQGGTTDNSSQTQPTSNTTPPALKVNYTQEELKILAAIIQAEADNQGTTGKLAVGSVIMNRVASKYFPNTISGVVFAPKQFSCVDDGHYQAIYDRGPNQSCISAAKAVLEGKRTVPYLFYTTVAVCEKRGYPTTGYQDIGAHRFWGTVNWKY